MKKPIGSIFLLAAGFSTGFILAKIDSNPTSIVSSPVAAIQGEDSYEIRFEGSTGDRFVGVYIIGTIPTRIEKIEDRLPYKVTFNAPRSAYVTATGSLYSSNSQVKVTILRNGIECHKELAVGSGVSKEAKTCL
ncbi:hypothetical protein [Pseudanabaena sp. PCC 6802]|uniref:hypothetical protein n=1 Tax=Pseudanabaena sp. PCC 6802 TaxID=118173 RepID=UPI00034CAFD4|nr:hypothetical protein [Pseudanabaena sp. PCC 6802]